MRSIFILQWIAFAIIFLEILVLCCGLCAVMKNRNPGSERKYEKKRNESADSKPLLLNDPTSTYGTSNIDAQPMNIGNSAIDAPPANYANVDAPPANYANVDAPPVNYSNEGAPPVNYANVPQANYTG